MIAKCKLPKEELGGKETQIVERWGIQEGFNHFDNSKVLKRQKTKWEPPTSTQLKLNFDGAAKGGIGAAGGVLRDRNGDVLLVYSENVGGGSNNLVEAMALLWGLQLIREMQIKEITMGGDSKLIIDLVKGVSKPSWNILNVTRDIRNVVDMVADVVIAMGFELRKLTCWRNLESLKEELKALIDKEKEGSKS